MKNKIIKNKRGRVVSYVLAASLAMGMTGCQLAKEEAPQKEITATDSVALAGQDQLCGAYITFEGDKSIEGKDKIYATKARDSEGKMEYEFNGLSGSCLFFTTYIGNKEDDSYVSSAVFGFLTDVNFHVGVHESEDTNEKEEVSNGKDNTYQLSGTLNVVKNKSAISELYPIYQDKEGKLYIATNQNGSRCQFNGTESMAQELKENYTKTVNGQKQTMETIVKITVQAVDEAQYVVVKEMDKNERVLHASTYKKKDFKEKTDKSSGSRYEEKTLKLQKETEYLIVEEHVADQKGKKKINRSIVTYNPEEEDNEVLCNFANNNGVIDIRSITLLK